MEFVHSCSFCGWSRASATAVMLAPGCAACGCALDSRGAGAGDSAQVRAGLVLPAWTTRLLLALRPLLVLLVLYAAAKVGYETAGASGALIGFGTTGLLLMPFVPQQPGTSRR